MATLERLLEELEGRGLVEAPFRSNVPLVGGVIAWFRERWNGVATRWYVRPLLQQQNEVNALWLRIFRIHLEAVQAQLSMLEQDQLEVVEQLADLKYRLGCLEQRVARINDGGGGSASAESSEALGEG